MEFVVADLPDGEPEQQVFLRIKEPAVSDISRALLANEPIHYGTHFILTGAAAGELVAICISGPWAAPGEPGHFLLCVDQEPVSEAASREQALNHLLLGLGG